MLRKLLRLSAPEWHALAQAQAALLWAQLLLWTQPRGRLFRAPASGEPANPSGSLAPEVRQLALAVARVAEYGLYRPSCLVRSLALHRLLAAHGLRGGVLRVGARLSSGRFAAHAWVEYDGHVLGDEDWHVRQFAELARLHADPAS